MTNNATISLAKWFGVCCAMLSVTTSAYAQDAGVSDERIARGEQVFSNVADIGCRSCHGEYAEGDLGVGPFIRGANEGMIRAAVEGIGEMVAIKNVITDEQIEDVSAYLGYLGTAQVARSLVKRGRFLPEVFSARPGTRLHVILQNGSFAPQAFTSDNMGIGTVDIDARNSASLIWDAPAEGGAYTLYCTDCKLPDQYFTININSQAPEFRPIAPGIASSTSEAGLYLYE